MIVIIGNVIIPSWGDIINYYNEIKEKLLDCEIYDRVKNYSKERNRLLTYFETGKLLYEAGSK